MKRNFSLVLVLFALFFQCEKDPIPGCTDSQALNKDFGADENDGSCQYSEVTFYARYAFFNGIPITKIELSVDGSEVGNISANYPNGPGNCAALGTVKYSFTNSDSIDWNSTVFLANGTSIFDSGNVLPSTSLGCIKVNITN